MLRLLVTRLVGIVPVLVLVSVATFLLLELVPGDPAVSILGPDATPEQYDRIRTQLGLDQPGAERYFNWMGGVLSGDLGQSLRPPNEQVHAMLLQRLPITLQVTVMAIGIALLIAVPAAIHGAQHPDGWLDRVLSGGAFAAVSIPNFLLGIFLVYIAVFNSIVARVLTVGVVTLFAGARAWQGVRRVRDAATRIERRHRAARHGLAIAALALLAGVLWVAFPEFPRQGWSRLTGDGGLWANLRHAFLPALTLALLQAAIFMQVLRSDLRATLQEDFILAARAKGLSPTRIMWVDALRPSLFSLLTIVGVSLGALLGGAIIVEQIFNLPGIGTMMVTAITGKDFPVVQSTVLVVASVYVILNAGVDVLYSFLDPRVRRTS